MKINLDTVNLRCHGIIVDRGGCLQLRTELRLLERVKQGSEMVRSGPLSFHGILEERKYVSLFWVSS